MGDISRLTIIFAVAVLLQQELLGSRVLAENRDLGGSCDTNNDCRDNDPTMICVFLECRCAPGYSTDNQNPYECQGCGRNLTGSTGTFTSPNHPDEYPWGGDCRWHITVPPGMFIWLSFSQFAIERDIDNCTYQDTVSVYDSSTVSANSLLAKLCGVDAPGNYTSTNNVMTVRLTMNSEESEDGFVASYISFPAPLGEPCGNDNHCGDNELTEICQNSTCVCAPGYTQEGSECTEEVSVGEPAEPTCNCTVQGDPEIIGFDKMGVFISPVNNHYCVIADTKSCSPTVNPNICTYTIIVKFGPTGLPIAATLRMRNAVDGRTYRYKMPDAQGTNPDIGSYVIADIDAVTNTHTLTIDHSTCQIKISVQPDQKVDIFVQKDDENQETCHKGLCGHCNGVFDDYYLADGTSVQRNPDMFDLMRDSYCYYVPFA